MISVRGKKYLSLVLKASEGLGIQYPVPVALKTRPDVARRFFSFPSLGIHAESSMFA
jgi:hypothetical protein